MEESDKIWTTIISIVAGAGVIASFLVNFIIAGPILGVIAGFALSYFVQTRTQRRSWKREFLLKNIDLIYGPLYNESISLENQYQHMLNNRHYYNFKKTKWDEIRDSYTYHMIEDEDFRKELDNFYLLIDSFNELRHYSQEKVDEMVKKSGSEFYDLNVEKITFFQVTETHLLTANVNDCLLFNIHPKDTFVNPNAQSIIQIMNRIENTDHQIEKKNPEDFEQFDKLWQKMLDEVSQDKNIQRFVTMAIELHVENLRLRQKLVKRVNERQKL